MAGQAAAENMEKANEEVKHNSRAKFKLEANSCYVG